MSKRCDDCGGCAKFQWRWAGFQWRWAGFPEHGGYLCFICRSFTAGGRPGAEVRALPKNWHPGWQRA